MEAKKPRYLDVYTSILIEEGEKNKLLDFVKENPTTVERFFKYLVHEFKDEVYSIFINYIQLAASRANSRRGYQEVCAIIRNLKKAGGKTQVADIIQSLLLKYHKKPAFRDELSRIGK